MIDLPNEGRHVTSAVQSDDEHVVDVVDNVARPRGRPRKMRNNVDRGNVVVCKICGRHHETHQCICYARMQESAARFRDYSGPQKRCSICTEPGHNMRRCPLRLDAIAHYSTPNDDP